MKPEMGPPDSATLEFPDPDGSWQREIEAFEEDILSGRAPRPGLGDALATLEIVDEIYRQNLIGK